MILENLKNKKIILASKSPRRASLLSDAGFEFEVFVKENINENPGKRKGKDAAIFLADEKAKHYNDILKPETLLITADTIVCLKGKILNKPKNAEEAKKMLKILSDKKHEVITGVCIKSSERKILFSVSTKVYFRKLSDNEINYYIENYKPFDKAGAYGIQEWIGIIGIEKIKGSYFNVMGLPVQKIYEKLSHFI
jgi:septum formation protein